MPQGYLIEIAVPSGDPEAVQEITKSDWLGQGFIFGRGDLAEATRIPNLNSPGVYLLLGEDHSDKYTQKIYVGQSDNVSRRLKQQNLDPRRDYWVKTMAFVSRTGHLNKAHSLYLEATLTGLAKSTGQVAVDGVPNPEPRAEHQNVRIVADAFLDGLLGICRVLGLKIFGPLTRSRRREAIYSLSGPDAHARGVYRSSELEVQAGAQMRRDSVDSLSSPYVTLRSQLMKRGIVREEGEVLIFGQNYRFDSPSAAATVLLGRSANGRIEWKDADGVCLRDREDDDG